MEKFREEAYKYLAEYLWNEMERLRNQVISAERDYIRSIDDGRPESSVRPLREKYDTLCGKYAGARNAYLEWFKTCVERGVY